MENTLLEDQYIKRMKEIDENILQYIEKDLAFFEKVSLAFLLYGNNSPHWALQRLLILSRSPEELSDFLNNYTIINKDNWKVYIIEALTIIKANKVLRKLGFNVRELREHFLPHHPELSLFIHPILKGLYFMCEELTPADACKIIKEIKDSNSSANELPFNEPKYLEVYLLDWITKSIISIGDFSKSTSNQINKINLEPIYQCLKLYEWVLVKDMLTSCVQQMNDALEVRKTTTKLKREQLNQNDSALCADNSNFERKASVAMIEDERYLIRKKWAGFILIINQEKFFRDTNPEVQDLLPKKKLKDRRGTQTDKDELEKTFQSFGYKPHTINNQTNIQMLNEIRDIVKRSESYDSLIICILSHGIEGAVYGSNSVPVGIKKIKDILTSDALLNKPKFLIIQACQGEDLQTAKFVSKFEYDSPNHTAPPYSNILVATSTVPGFASVRHIERGTWFIQSLCKHVDSQGDRKHMLDILTLVIRDVSSKRGYENECMVPLIQHTLTKNFFLPQRF